LGIYGCTHHRYKGPPLFHNFSVIPLFPCFFVLWSLIELKILNFSFYLFVYFFCNTIMTTESMCNYHHLTRKNGTSVSILTPTINYTLKIRWPLRFVCSYCMLHLLHTITSVQETYLLESSRYRKCWQKIKRKQ